MVDIMFSAASRLMRIVGGFACAPRKSSQLPLQISVIEPVHGNNTRRRSMSMTGWLKDISETGVGMMVPNIRMGDCYFTGVDRRLKVAIELAGGPLQLKGCPVRLTKVEARNESSVSYALRAQGNEVK